MIAKKTLFFKGFSGMVFERKMQFIHRGLAGGGEFIHNILWSVGKSGTSYPYTRLRDPSFFRKIVCICVK